MAHVLSAKSKAGNEFFKFKFKIEEVACVTTRIMKQANQTITENYLQKLNQEREREREREREPVTFKKLSKTPYRLHDDTHFLLLIYFLFLMIYGIFICIFQLGEKVGLFYE